jgi:hypothetical protein
VAFSVGSIRKAQNRRRSGTPALPPLGSFDPSLLLQYNQNRRTTENAQQQFDLGQSQAQDDLAIQMQRVSQQQGESQADIATGRQRLTEDHTTALNDLNRNYAVLANKQAEGALKANVASPGLLAQALARRQGNLAADQKPIDTAFQRGLTDSSTAEQRLGEDASSRKADLLLSLSRAYGSGTRGQPLGANTLSLLQTKNDALGGNLDLTGVAYQQAAANGFRFPRRRRRTVLV